jgi:primosomal replication protein N
MPSLNHACLLGTLPRTPTIHQTAQGTPVCTFDLQVDVAGRENACVIRVVVLER